MVIMKYLKLDVFGELLVLTSWNKRGAGTQKEVFVYTCALQEMVRNEDLSVITTFSQWDCFKPVSIPGRRFYSLEAYAIDT